MARYVIALDGALGETLYQDFRPISLDSSMSDWTCPSAQSPSLEAGSSRSGMVWWLSFRSRFDPLTKAAIAVYISREVVGAELGQGATIKSRGRGKGEAMSHAETDPEGGTNAGTAARPCAFCFWDVSDTPEHPAVRCPTCGSLYHAECWEENGSCAVFGCKNWEDGQKKQEQARSAQHA